MSTQGAAAAVAPVQPALPCWCRGSGGYATVFRTSRFGLLRCRECGCYQINPPALRTASGSGEFYSSYYAGRASCPDEGAPGADGGRGRPRRGRRDSRFWMAAARAPQLQAVADSVVDIGCGDGGLCAELQEAGWATVTGIDVAQGRVERAQRKYPSIRFCCGSLAEAGLPRDSVDLVTMDNVIEHLPEPVSFLEDVRSWLKPDAGRIVLITPNMESGNFVLLGARWTPELAPHAHVFLFTRDSLVRLLEGCGYRVDGTGSFTVGWPYWGGSVASLVRGRVREGVWGLGQAAGDLFGRVVRQGSMIFATGTRVR